MKLWKVAVVVEISVFARTKEAAMEESLKIPWRDLEDQPISAKIIRQITHIKHLPDGVTEDDFVWVADESKDLLPPEDASVDAALTIEARVKMGLKLYGQINTDSE